MIGPEVDYDAYKQLNTVCMTYEAKLKELMGEDAFQEFAMEVAKSMFANEILGMADGEFKETILDNFDAITGSDADFQDLINRQLDNTPDDNDHDCGADY